MNREDPVFEGHRRGCNLVRISELLGERSTHDACLSGHSSERVCPAMGSQPHLGHIAAACAFSLAEVAPVGSMRSSTSRSASTISIASPARSKRGTTPCSSALTRHVVREISPASRLRQAPSDQLGTSRSTRQASARSPQTGIERRPIFGASTPQGGSTQLEAFDRFTERDAHICRPRETPSRAGCGECRGRLRGVARGRSAEDSRGCGEARQCALCRPWRA